MLQMHFLELSFLAVLLPAVLAAPVTTVLCETYDFRISGAGVGGRALCSEESAYKWDGTSTSVTPEYDSAGSTCDHVLEVSIATLVIQQRFCPGMDASKTLTNEQKTTSLEKLKNIINAQGVTEAQRNTFFFTVAPEAVKGRAVEKWVQSKFAYLAKQFLQTEKTSASLKAGYSPAKIVALADYLTKTQANSNKVANLLDNAMASEAKAGGFPLKAGTSTTIAVWKKFLAWYAEVSELASKELPPAGTESTGKPGTESTEKQGTESNEKPGTKSTEKPGKKSTEKPAQ
ncbi:hypothetical protein F5051DRAFT_432316 [Lentinula edodes]|nr:hypothetical protein F5051DRAFT_432316 [Lentinula edodes]